MTESVQVRLARLDFQGATQRDVAGIPRIDADRAAEQGPRALLVDCRERHELAGPLGFVPSSRHVPLARITELLELGPGARVALLSQHGRRAGAAARLLELAGMTCVAAIDGGLVAWRAAGLPTTHDEAGIDTSLPVDVDAELQQPERSPGPVSLAEVQRLISDRARVRWVKLAAFLLHGRTACVDGRDSHGVVGTPGGDAGELLLALAAAEACGQPISEADLPCLLRAWIDAFGRFYLHSDIPALNRVIAALRADPRVPEAALPDREAPPSAWRQFMLRPSHGVRAAVREHLADPNHVGCGHLRLSLLHGDVYAVRPELVRAFFGAYFDGVWEGLPELEFVVLGGGHQEGGVLLVRTETDLFPYSRVPLVPPAVSGVQVFVHHPQVTAFQRKEVAHWLTERPELPRLLGRFAEVHAMVGELGARQMEATLGHLALGLPIFEATFAQDRSVVVKQIGAVGGA